MRKNSVNWKVWVSADQPNTSKHPLAGLEMKHMQKNYDLASFVWHWWSYYSVKNLKIGGNFARDWQIRCRAVLPWVALWKLPPFQTWKFNLFLEREIVGNAQRNVLMLSLTFQRQQHTAAPTTGPLQLYIQNHQGHFISFDVLFRYVGERKDPFQ